MFTAGGISHSDRKFMGRLLAPPFDTGLTTVSWPFGSSDPGSLFGDSAGGLFLHGSAVRYLFYSNNSNTRQAPGSNSIFHLDIAITFSDYDGFPTASSSASLDFFGFKSPFTVSSKNPFIDSSNPEKGLTPYRTSSHDTSNGAFSTKYNIYTGEKAFFFPCISDQLLLPLRIHNAGSGYTNGSYDNLSTTATSGSGSGLKVNVTVTGGSVSRLSATLTTPLGLTSSSTGVDNSGYALNNVGTINGIPGGGSGAQYKIGATGEMPITGTHRSYRALAYLFMYQPASKAGGSLTNFGLNTLTSTIF
tara:strand:- start:56 stop:967 length:912 start_codon:yes stop_codon:yes gene_type:complete